MMEQVTNLDGDTVHVLDSGDLNRAKNSVIRWLLGAFSVVGLGMFSIGAYATNLQAKNDQQDVVLADYQAHAAWSREASRNLDSLRIEMRHLTATVEELSRLIAQRGIR